jgi:hypothetical protein
MGEFDAKIRQTEVLGDKKVMREFAKMLGIGAKRLILTGVMRILGNCCILKIIKEKHKAALTIV